MTASHRKPRLPFSITPTETKPKRWHIDRRDTHDDFVIMRMLGDGDLLMCRRPITCRFTVADRRRLISTARSKRMAAAQELHGIGNA